MKNIPIHHNSIQYKYFGVVISRRGITIQLSPSILTKIFILNTISFIF